MSAQRYSHQDSDAGHTTHRTRPTHANPRSYNLSAYHATASPYPQEMPRAPLSMQRFHPYPSNLTPPATSTMAPTFSYPTPPMSAFEARQQAYMYSNPYASHNAYYPMSAGVEAMPFHSSASQISSSIEPALVMPSGVGGTGVRHGTARKHIAQIDQFRDMSPGLYSPSSPGSPSSSSYYQPIRSYQPFTHVSPSLEPIPFLPQDPVTRVPCLWHGCRVMLDDISTAGIKRHIRDWHSDLSSALQKERKMCLWDEGSVCGRELDAASIAKHIASVHLKSTAQKCEYCHNTIGRADSLARHKRDHCPDRPHK